MVRPNITNEEFIKRAREAHGDFYDYSKVVIRGSTEKIEIICPIHGSFMQLYRQHTAMKQGCKACSIDKKRGVFKNPLPNDFKNTFHKLETLKDLSLHYKVPVDTIIRWSKQTGLSKRKIVDIDWDLYHELYIDKGLNLNEVADIMNIPVNTLKGKMIRNKDKIKRKVDVWRADRQTLTEEVLRRHHLDEMLTLSQIGRMYDVSDTHVGNLCREYNIETIHYPQNGDSLEEQELREFVQVIDAGASKFYFDQQEFDIVSKNYKLAIEYNGLYWHSDQYIDKNKHVNKMYIAAKHGYQLLTIYSDEWKFKKDIVKSIIKNKFGVTDYKIFARKCKIVDLSQTNANLFYSNNHIQGPSARLKYNYGLSYEDEIVAVMSFGLHPRNNEISLSRYATKLNTNVVGGASRLFKHFIKNTEHDSIVSWSDNRWSNGALYKTLEFNYGGDIKPSYDYTSGKDDRIPMQRMQKKKIGCPPEIKEHEFLQQKGFYRVWNCGRTRWLWKREK